VVIKSVYLLLVDTRCRLPPESGLLRTVNALSVEGGELSIANRGVVAIDNRGVVAIDS